MVLFGGFSWLDFSLVWLRGQLVFVFCFLVLWFYFAAGGLLFVGALDTVVCPVWRCSI